MENEDLPAIENHFGDLTDPRMDRTKLHKLLDIVVNAIDGKVLRRSHDKGTGKAAIDMVSACLSWTDSPGGHG